MALLFVLLFDPSKIRRTQIDVSAADEVMAVEQPDVKYAGLTRTSADAAQQKHLQSSELKPVDCRSAVKRVDIDTDPTGREKVFVRTDTTNPFLIALHKRQHDRVRWDIATYGRYYEWSLEEVWTSILKLARPSARILDVGGNIGYYSLLSASLGNFTIDSFEPNPTNVLRFCESVGVNYWWDDDSDFRKDDYEGVSDEAVAGQPRELSELSSLSNQKLQSQRHPSIRIWEMGVSEVEGSLSFFLDKSNPGAGRFINEKEKRLYQLRYHPSAVAEIPVTTLDSFARRNGWFRKPVVIEILKVDVERHEAQVLLGARELIQSRMVKNVFTEVGKDVDRNAQEQALMLLVDAGYQLKGQGTFRGPGEPPTFLQHGIDKSEISTRIMDVVLSMREPYLNLWWASR